ncbi:MAG: TrkA C-terminal domain-containing protein, partial [Phycisphaeraceae bacterium]|nr:TrkA C-terminal domain-containing protein [Phycisphaeraceae bacterium]
IGNDFEANCLVTVVLKTLDVERVISRAITHVSARILRGIGADDVANPEEESADRWAQQLMSPSMLRQLDLEGGYRVVETPVPSKWVDKTLKDLDLRAKEGLHVVAVRAAVGGAGEEDEPVLADGELPSLRLPDPERKLSEGESVVVIGSNEALAKLDSSG